MATILVVEDDDVVQKLVSVILRADGHEVITASNGVEGIALYRSSPDQFALILTDLEMPAMNGHQLIDLARQTNAAVKILCMSGYSDESIPANTEFLPKPFQPGVLRSRVHELLNRR